jgi:hypothetical protein
LIFLPYQYLWFTGATRGSGDEERAFEIAGCVARLRDHVGGRTGGGSRIRKERLIEYLFSIVLEYIYLQHPRSPRSWEAQMTISLHINDMVSESLDGFASSASSHFRDEV